MKVVAISLFFLLLVPCLYASDNLTKYDEIANLDNQELIELAEAGDEEAENLLLVRIFEDNLTITYNNKEYDKSSAFKQLEISAKKGDPVISFFVASEYFDIKKHAEAMKLLENSYNKDFYPSGVLLARIYAAGIGTAKNIVKANQLFKDVFKNGSDDMRDIITNDLLNGTKLVKKDHKLLAQLYTENINDQSTDLMLFNYGQLYLKGVFGEKSGTKALKYLQKSADKGNNKAMWWMVLLYLNGNLIPMDEEKAAEIATELFERDKEFMKYYAFHYGAGSVPILRDAQKSKYYLEEYMRSFPDDEDTRSDYEDLIRSIDDEERTLQRVSDYGIDLEKVANKDPKESYKMALYLHNNNVVADILFKPRNGKGGYMYTWYDYEFKSNDHSYNNPTNEPFKYFKIAYDGGVKCAGAYIGEYYLKGFWVDKNITIAKKYLKEALANGCSDANYSYGYIAQNGIDTKTDNATAINYYQLAADKGNKFASYAIYYILTNGNTNKPNAKAIKYLKLSAEQKNILAMLNLGEYYTTPGKNSNLQEAKKLYININSMIDENNDSALDKLIEDKSYWEKQLEREKATKLRPDNKYTKMLDKLYPKIIDCSWNIDVINSQGKISISDDIYINYNDNNGGKITSVSLPKAIVQLLSNAAVKQKKSKIDYSPIFMKWFIKNTAGVTDVNASYLVPVGLCQLNDMLLEGHISQLNIFMDDFMKTIK